MKSYWDLTAKQQVQVDADPTVMAATTADDAALHAETVARDARDATRDACTLARAEATARLFGKGKLK